MPWAGAKNTGDANHILIVSDHPASRTLLGRPQYRGLSKTPDSNHQINCKIPDYKWHQCE